VTSPGYPSLHDTNDQRQPPLQPGDELAGKYRMESVLGAGAMGVVVRAWHIELEQPVAVKFLYPEFARNVDGAERFRREARAAAKIKNQHVARVLDVGTLEAMNIPYIVMEYLAGRDLSHELQLHGPLRVGVAVSYVMQACEAVAEAHERGIVHRDLKPANLFLAEGAHGERMIKVLDFGISKVNGNGGPQQFSLTDTATLMGSPAYMSPEQLESSRNVDGRADIWSLGVILHELILGRVPFHGDSVPQLVRSILSGTRSTLLELDANLHELESVVARCLAQDREHRFESVSALREALRPFAERSPGSSSAHPRVHGGSASDRERPDASRAQPSATSDRSETPNEPGSTTAGPEQATGGTQVPSAWGNTQRGGHRPWQRRGIPLALLLGLVGIGAYWGVSSWVSSSRPSPLPSERELASAPDPGHGEGVANATAPAAVLAAQPIKEPAPGASDPSPAERGATVGKLPAADPAPNGASPVRVVPAPSGEAAIRVAPASARDQPVHAPPVAAGTSASGQRSGTPAPAAPASSTPKANRTAPRPEPASPTGTEASRAASRGNAEESGDKPAPEPSTRGAVELPDYGGRE
jgi:serine/threonine protein kinase